MANKRDIMGLLTGIPSQGISPLSQLTPQQMRAQAVQGGIEAMGRGMRGLMTGERRTPQQVQQANLRKALSEIDLSSTEGLTQYAKIQQQMGDLGGAVKTLESLTKLKEKEGLRNTLIDIAKAQGRDDVVEFLVNGGDLTKASEVVFRAGSIPKPASLTDNEELLYKDFLKEYSKEELRTAGLETNLLGNLSDALERSIINLAEEIYTNKPELGRELALAEAIRVKGGGTTSESTQATPTGSDPYGGYNVTNVN